MLIARRWIVVAAILGELGLLVGQPQWLVANWVKLGTLALPLLLAAGLWARRRSDVPWTRDAQFLSVLMLAAYLVHQFEEHWIDVLGNQYAFFGYVNELLSGILSPGEPIEPLTPAAILVTNTALVWLVGVLAIAFSSRQLFPMLALGGVVAVNAVAHINAAIVTRTYNPGLLTAGVLFVPLAGFVYWQFLRRDRAVIWPAVTSLVWAILAHALMGVGVLGANVFHLYPESWFFAALIAWSLVPVALYRPGKRWGF